MGSGIDIFSFLWGLIREHPFQLRGGDKGNIVGQDLFDVFVTDRHIFFGLTKDSVDDPDDVLEEFDVSVFPADDPFPVPLVHIDGMDIVGDLIPADRDHVGIETFADLKAVFFQSVAFPLGQRLNDFTGPSVLEYIEGYGALYTVEVVIQTGCRIDKKRSGDALKIQALGKKILKEVLDDFDGDLCIVKVEIGFVVFWDVKVFHVALSASG